MQTPDSPWERGAPYDLFMGRWSRRIADKFLRWLSMPADLAWLEIGCGTGSLSRSILSVASPTRILAIDPSEGYIEQAKRTIDDPRITFRVGDASVLLSMADRFDITVSGLVLNFIPEPLAALRAMARICRRGGMVAAYVWDYAERMEMLRYFWDAVVALDPGASHLDEGTRFPICRPDKLEMLFKDAGLESVEVESIDTVSVFNNFEDYWSPFLGGQGPAPGYVSTLDANQRATLEKKLRSILPIHPDGTIALDARAWAARGVS